VIPAQSRHALTGGTDDLELLEVTLPAVLATQHHVVPMAVLQNSDDQLGQ
jgi:hypothetical protein